MIHLNGIISRFPLLPVLAVEIKLQNQNYKRNNESGNHQNPCKSFQQFSCLFFRADFSFDSDPFADLDPFAVPSPSPL